MKQHNYLSRIIIVHVIDYQSEKYVKTKNNVQLSQIHSLRKVIKKYRQKGRKASYKEIHQIYTRVVFELMHINELTPKEMKRSMENIILLNKKSDRTIKA